MSMVGVGHRQILNTHPGHRGDFAVVDGCVDGLTRCRPKKGSTRASGWMVQKRSAFCFSRPWASFAGLHGRFSLERAAYIIKLLTVVNLTVESREYEQDSGLYAISISERGRQDTHKIRILLVCHIKRRLQRRREIDAQIVERSHFKNT